MRFVLFFPLLVLCLISCEDYSSEDRRINYQGLPSIHNLELGTEGVKIDSISFASSKVRYLVTGHFILNGREEFYTIYFDKHPMDQEAEVDVFKFDNEELENVLSECSIEFDKNSCEIVWSGKGSRIYLNDKISEEH